MTRTHDAPMPLDDTGDVFCTAPPGVPCEMRTLDDGSTQFRRRRPAKDGEPLTLDQIVERNRRWLAGAAQAAGAPK